METAFGAEYLEAEAEEAHGAGVRCYCSKPGFCYCTGGGQIWIIE